MPDYDVIVVGAGIFGLSSAYHIKRNNPSISVLVVDKESDAGQANTSRSVGGIRSGLFTSEVNRILSETSIDFYIDIQNKGGYELGIKLVGYLLLFTRKRFELYKDYLIPIIATGKAKILKHEEMSNLPIRLKFNDEEASILGIEDLEYAIFSRKSGYLDVEKLVSYYKEMCVKNGVDFKFNTKVERLLVLPEKRLGIPREPRAWQPKVIAGIETDKGIFESKNIVIAAGAWTPNLLDPIGIDSFVKPKKRQIFTIKAKTSSLKDTLYIEGFNDYSTLPMTFFIGYGLYVVPRPHEGNFWIGFTDDIGRGYILDMEPEAEFYYDNIYPLLSKFMPQFKDVRPDNMWAGCYSINPIDEVPIVFKKLNLVVATGGSGSGVMKADAVGRIVASLCMGKKEVELYGGVKFNAEVIGIENRKVEKEHLVL